MEEIKKLTYSINTVILLLVFGLAVYFAKASHVEVKIWVCIVFAVAVTAIIWAMYVPLFGMELPVGSLFE